MQPTMSAILIASISTVIGLILTGATGSFQIGMGVAVVAGGAMAFLSVAFGWVEFPIEAPPSPPTQPESTQPMKSRTIYDTLCGPERG